jgi:aryl-alcohol dehydrogenase-like predicted oxidoreductase
VLAAGAAVAAGAVVGLPGVARAAPDEGAGRPSERALPRRPFGKTGFESTLFGLGCFPLGKLPDEDEAVGIVLRALDAGCNYLDTAPSYARSEKRVGLALRDRPDAEVFVATKTHTRTEGEARKDLETSLERLRVERVDMVQVHAVSDRADLQRVLQPGGPLTALVKARDEGLLRFIGVTGHYDPVVMREAIAAWAFDSLLFPLNCVDPHGDPDDPHDPHALSFLHTTLPAAVENGLARVAMKIFASGNLVERGIDAETCLRYVLGLDVSTAVLGCRSVAEVDLAVRVTRAAQHLDAQEEKTLLLSTARHTGAAVEWYKRVN